METNNENNETGKVSVHIRMEPELHAVITDIATQEDRPVSSMIQRLLKTDPRIAPALETQTAGAGA